MTHTEAPISITVKSAAGSLITLRASNAEELDQSVALSLASLASATAELEAAVRGNNAAVPPQPATATVAAAFNATVIDSSPSQGAGSRVCPHGTMTRIHGLTGKFGPYIQWGSVNVPKTEGDTVFTLQEKLKAKEDASLHTLGDFVFRKGQYGPFMFKKGGGKPQFVSLPEGLDPKLLTLEAATRIYQNGLTEKGKAPRKKYTT